MSRLNRTTYEALIAQDQEWLDGQPSCLERGHISVILGRAADHEYGLLGLEEAASLREPDELQTRTLAETYAAIEAGVERTRAAQAEAAMELPQVAGPVANRIRVYRQEVSERVDALHAQLAECRALLERLRDAQGVPAYLRRTTLWADLRALLARKA